MECAHRHTRTHGRTLLWQIGWQAHSQAACHARNACHAHQSCHAWQSRHARHAGQSCHARHACQFGGKLLGGHAHPCHARHACHTHQSCRAHQKSSRRKTAIPNPRCVQNSYRFRTYSDAKPEARNSKFEVRKSKVRPALRCFCRRPAFAGLVDSSLFVLP
jgi:hypothetical protein